MTGLFGRKRPRTAGAQRGPQGPAPRSQGQIRLQRLLVGLAFAVLVAALTKKPQEQNLLPQEFDTSGVALEDVKAAFTFQSEDLLETKGIREQAAALVYDHYRIDGDLVQAQVQALRARIAQIEVHRPGIETAIRDALLGSTSFQSDEDLVIKALHAYAANLKEENAWEDMPGASVIALWLRPDMSSIPTRQFETPTETDEGADAAEETPQPVQALAPAGPIPFLFTFGEKLRELSLGALEEVMNEGVRQAALDPRDADKTIVVLGQGPLAGPQSTRETLLSDVPNPEQALAKSLDRLVDMARTAAKETEEPTAYAKLHDAAMAIAGPWVHHSLREDNFSTARAKDQARASVEPIMKEILQNELIQPGSRQWTPQSRSDLETYRGMIQGSEEKPVRRALEEIFAHAILVGLILLCLHRALSAPVERSATSSVKQLNLALLMMCAALLAGRAASYFEPTGFVVPIAATGILYAILVNGRIAGMVSCLTAVLVSVQYGYDWRILILGGAMSLAGVFSIFRVRKRSHMTAASVMATLIGLLAMVAISLAMDSPASEAAWRRLLLVALNGGICMMAVPGLLSPLERLFGITTDIQLLEYSDLNNEILGELAIKAPGTYAHSLMLGQLAEAAADAIGANGLLARVSAYYHDVGKMRRSEYFSENQTGENIHDELPPRLSARAIASHVVQGAEMAREARLPKPIVDGILEHHGTCLIGYFYQQAMEQQKHGDVQEEHFRYPGPKPQSPETAILMICDASESGVRSIKNPNEERVREFVDKIIQARYEDGQFDDCDLTLRQLNNIAGVVSRRIMTHLHTRVAYPDMKDETKVDNVIPLSGGAK